jgi:hypothetical protein
MAAKINVGVIFVLVYERHLGHLSALHQADKINAVEDGE